MNMYSSEYAWAASKNERIILCNLTNVLLKNKTSYSKGIYKGQKFAYKKKSSVIIGKYDKVMSIGDAAVC